MYLSGTIPQFLWVNYSDLEMKILFGFSSDYIRNVIVSDFPGSFYFSKSCPGKVFNLSYFNECPVFSEKLSLKIENVPVFSRKMSLFAKAICEPGLHGHYLKSTNFATLYIVIK
jgi:hypothetical protein